MRQINWDLDGVIVPSESYKAAQWALAKLRQSGVLSEVDYNMLVAGDGTTARRLYDWVCTEQAPLHQFVRGLAGLSRGETLRRLWSAFPEGGNAEDLDHLRDASKESVMGIMTEPIAGTVRFARAAAGRLRQAIVTQTDDASVCSLIRRGVVPGGVFDAVVCCGGNPRLAAISGSSAKKVAAHIAACEQFGVPPSAAIAIDDSVDGLRAAREAGLVCVGLRQAGNPHDLAAYADVVVSDLGPLARPDVIDALANAGPAEVAACLKGVAK